MGAKFISCMSPHLFPSILRPGTWCCVDKVIVPNPQPDERRLQPEPGAEVYRGATPASAYASWYFAGERQ